MSDGPPPRLQRRITNASGGIPVVGDWNGDGRDTAGVFRPDGHQWHMVNGHHGSEFDLEWSYKPGHADPEGVLPVAGVWSCGSTSTRC